MNNPNLNGVEALEQKRCGKPTPADLVVQVSLIFMNADLRQLLG